MPTSDFQVPEKYKYLNGFGSESIAGALPVGMNSPQKPAYGLYAEKFSGTAFTAPRKENMQSWLYRILPAAAHEPFERSATQLSGYSDKGAAQFEQIPNQLRWDPFDIAPGTDFLSGLELVSGAGDPATKTGLAIYVYCACKNMEKNQAFYSADGDFLIVAQNGSLDVHTELGKLLIRPNEICVIPRGVRFRVELVGGQVIRGYILELFQGHFQLPDLGPIGSNGLANARDFQAPVAFYEDDVSPWRITAKFGGQLFDAKQDHSPFNVVAWHGTYYPYKYDLGRFNTVGSISFDHPDPSIFTVLTAPSPVVGTAVADFVIFPPRWLVAEGTFRPPWYHRNTMSEFMGLISGAYDAKASGKGGFQPGGASLHNVMGAHGPDASTFDKASAAELAPQKVGDGAMAFMFESSLMLGVTEWSLRKCQKVQDLRPILPGSNAAINPVTNPENERESVEQASFGDARPSDGSDPSTEGASTFQTRPTSLDYYLRLAEKRLGALSPEESTSSPPERPNSIIGKHSLRTLTENRERDRPGAALAAFSSEHWKGVLQIWAEEVGLQYPFIDTVRLAQEIESASHDADTQPTFTPTSPQNTTVPLPNLEHRRYVEDTAILILMVVCLIVEPALVGTANPLAEEIYRDVLVRTHLSDVNRDDVAVMAVAASYFFLSDREVLAWRAISGVMRLLQEERVLQNYDESPSAATASATDDKLYWSAFTMERRFSFSTGLPFAVRDTDIQHWPHFTNASTCMSTAYLKSMVDYCRISSEVRKLILLPAAPPAPYALTATRDFLDFRVVQWQKNLPPSLVFRGVGDTFDPVREHRGEYRLRLILYLRGSQMRTVIHRKSGLAASGPLSAFDQSSANTLAAVAQDTIRILVALARDTDIYHAQHKTFNHFLETALTSLLLSAGTAPSRPFMSFLPDVVEAMSLVQRLSAHSPITKALAMKLRGIQDVVNAFRARVEGQPIMPSAEYVPAQNGQTVPDPATALDPSMAITVQPVSSSRLTYELGRLLPPNVNVNSPTTFNIDASQEPPLVPPLDPGESFLPSFDIDSSMFDVLGMGNILDDYENFAF
ncbi:hypothetical protein SEUCBS140593_005387 [Sporothrix eucalyptigena]|uniref:homogentisate 1,2-dioxygenase n=1 Tax=Sporothrix eucalyptigena TaxID=1812306 RepID=A0ABP0BWD7_9PEZI